MTATTENLIIDELDKLTVEHPDFGALPICWLECLTAFQNNVEWPIVDWMNELIDLVENHDIQRDAQVVSDARVILARRVLASTDNPILAAYAANPAAAEDPTAAEAAFTALGGGRPDFIRYLYDSTFPAFRENRRLSQAEQNVDEACVVLAALALPRPGANPIIALLEKHEHGTPAADPLFFLDCITAEANATAWPSDAPYRDEIELALRENDIARDSHLIADARVDLAQRILAVSENPILVAFRWEPDGGWAGHHGLPLAARAQDLLNGLGGPGPEFDFDAYEEASAESQIDAQRSEDESEIHEVRLVMAALALAKS